MHFSKKKSIFADLNQKDMSFINTLPREQLMLPISIDDYVSSDHFVRFIDAFGIGNKPLDSRRELETNPQYHVIPNDRNSSHET